MSPESYSWEVRESAEELYIIDGQTYDQVAKATSVSISQLKRWGMDSAPTWTERRREYRQAQTSIRRNVMLAKAKLIESVVGKEDPQKAYAFSALVSASKALDQEAMERNQQVADKEPVYQGEMTDDLAGALANAIQRKIGAMLQTPGGLNLNAIKELQQSMALMEKMKVETESGGSKNDQQPKMTPEELQAVIKKVYGS